MSRDQRPAADEHHPYYGRYIELVPESDVIAALDAQGRATGQLLGSISEEKSKHRYAPDKWSIRQVVGHMTDAERVFAFRALAFARGETQALPGFDEGPYVEKGGFDDLTLAELTEGLAAQRRASLALFRSLGDEAWDRRGVASGNPITVRALAFTIAGHERHHLQIVRERYLGAKE